ncbi:MAG TPA: hypothetical protein DCX54_08800 [Flavobacteriales bacterium]|nr:hypothetical protein [Flavobacteriales bacterium]
MDNNESMKTENDIIEQTSTYAIRRILIGALIGFVLSFLLAYLYACFKDGISVTVGIRIFRNPYIGMWLVGISFFGTIIGALASMFSKKWKADN